MITGDGSSSQAGPLPPPPLFRCLADRLPSNMSASAAPPTIAPPPEENHSDSSKLRIFIGILKK